MKKAEEVQRKYMGMFVVAKKSDAQLTSVEADDGGQKTTHKMSSEELLDITGGRIISKVGAGVCLSACLPVPCACCARVINHNLRFCGSWKLLRIFLGCVTVLCHPPLLFVC